jgi:hypothetical protein
VWTFWSKPFLAGRSFWKSGLHHLLSWALSLRAARPHFAGTALYTDDEGARMLVDGAGLEFDFVTTRLNDLAGHDPGWWALGKILTYSLQEEPFVHIDSDVYLWSPLPERLTAAPVLAQNPEGFNLPDPYYRLGAVREALLSVGGWCPVEMAEYVPAAGVPVAACCGIVGGRHVEFLRYYATQALRWLDEPANVAAWPLLRGPSLDLIVVLEQHLLVACLDYHSRRPGSPFPGVRIEYLFNDFLDAQRRAGETGFTHLLAHAKQDPEFLQAIEERVRKDCPAQYERCRRYWAAAH